jgi:hypothetical protein
VLAFNALMAFAAFGAVFALFAAVIGLVGFMLWRIVRALARVILRVVRPDVAPAQRRQSSYRSGTVRASARR